jgi:dihydrolipoamide dehydrogenase
MAKEFDVCVIGSGPGGYVAAIRASQLGFSTAIIEKRHLGGVCLNIGCIPTKALLRSAEVLESIQHASDYGIEVSGSKADFGGMVKRSRGVANKMSKGVQFLMKANKIQVFMGTGVFASKNELQVQDESGKETERIKAKHFIIATGARPRVLPNLPIDGKMTYRFGSRNDHGKATEENGYCWGWCHWGRVCLFLPHYWHRGYTSRITKELSSCRRC